MVLYLELITSALTRLKEDFPAQPTRGLGTTNLVAVVPAPAWPLPGSFLVPSCGFGGWAAWVEDAALGVPGTWDLYGRSVDIRGDTAVVGSPDDGSRTYRGSCGAGSTWTR